MAFERARTQPTVPVANYGPNVEMLMRLEKLLVSEAERDAAIDDHTLVRALQKMIEGSAVRPSESAAPIADALHQWRFVEDDDRRTELAMRLIKQSIENRSGCQQGDYSYLIYASAIVKRDGLAA